MNKLFLSLLSFFLLARAGWSQIPSNVALTNVWTPDNQVTAVIPCADKVVLAGDFRWMGPFSGGGVVIDKDSFTPESGSPHVYGDVEVVIPDGNGGWYIGGFFSQVGSVIARNLAHILPDNSVDASWTPNPDSGIRSLILSGTILYVGGSFSNIAGQARSAAASFDNGVITSWDPNVTGLIYSMALTADNRVFLGGQFSAVGGTARRGVAAVDATTGVLTSWNANLLPSGSAGLRSVELSGTSVYIGGAFTNAGGSARTNVAQLDATTAAASSWNPGANGLVYDIVADGSTIYLGGLFSTAGGQPRTKLAAIDKTTGLATAFNTNLVGGSVIAMAVVGTELFVGGTFTSANGNGGDHEFVVLDKTTGATASRPQVDLNSAAVDFAFDGNRMYLGGDFEFTKGLNGVYKNGLIALDTITHQPTAWDPELGSPGSSYQFQCANDTLFVFEKNTPNIFAVSMADATVLSDWAPAVNGNITSWAFSDDAAYLHGTFDIINSDSRPLLGAVDLKTGATLPWTPATGGDAFTALTMAVHNDALYLGGDITLLDGQGRGNLAAFSATTGELLPWAPDIQYPTGSLFVETITADNNHVYVTGSFNQINGETRYNVARINVSDGQLDPWAPDVEEYDLVSQVFLRGNHIFVVGSMNGNNEGTKVYELQTGEPVNWNPDLGGIEGYSVLAIAAINHKLYVGGDFEYEAGRQFAVYDVAKPGAGQNPAIISTYQTVQINGQIIVPLPALISDPDDDVDFSSLEIVNPPSSGAVAFIDGEYNLIIQYQDVNFAGTEALTIRVCDLAGGCTTQEITLEVVGDVIAYNAVSPNQDNLNEIFLLQYIDVIPDAVNNHVSIFDRTGNVVFEVDNYDNTSRVFRGLNNSGNALPSGTYYYRVDFKSGMKSKTGFISLKK